MLTVVCCGRGAPGATSTALTLAAAWPARTLMVEADPYGGDLAFRCRTPEGLALPETPTVLTAAVAARTDVSAGMLGRYANRLNDSLGVVSGHLAAEQGSGVTDWEPLARAMAGTASTGPVIVDLGRIHGASPSLPIAAAADVVVVVTRADVGSVLHLRERLARLVPVLAQRRGWPPRIVPVVVTGRRQGAAHAQEIAELLADTPAGPVIAGVGSIAWDPTGLERLERSADAVGLSRTPLLKSAAKVVDLVRAAQGSAVATHV